MQFESRLDRRQRRNVFLTAMKCIRECKADGCTKEETMDHVRAAVGVDALEIDINPDNLALILAFLEKILPILIQVFF